MISEPIRVTLLVIEVLEKLGIPYVVGGSLASARHGTVRSTLDSDLVVRLKLEDVAPLVAHLEEEFYIDGEMARKAIVLGQSFNIIHLETIFKVDFFVAHRPFDEAQLVRRQLHPVSADEKMVYMLTAEDTILAKLAWYRLGGETSERQWRDIEGIIAVQAERLDWVYIEETGRILNVSDLVERVKNAI